MTGPAVTEGVANAASVIASKVSISAVANPSGTFILNAAAPWRYLSTAPAVRGQSYPDQNYVVPNNISASFPAGSIVIEFEFDGQQFEFSTKGFAGSAYRLMVYGQYVSATPTAGPGAAGSLYLTLVNFGSRATRRIRIEGSATFYFGGLNIGPNDTPPWPSSLPVGPRVVVMGDSFVGGTGASGATVNAWFDTMAKLLGWRDVWATGLGGTGYLATGAFVKFRDRVVADVINQSPDIVVVAGGINDTAFTKAQIQTEAGLLYAQIRAALPNVKLIAVGPWVPSGSPASAPKTAANI